MRFIFRRMKKRGTDYVRSKSSQNASQLGMEGMQSRSGGAQIKKTTVISVQHTRQGSDHGSDSDVELVSRNKDAMYFARQEPREI